jgi:hypothetical protein
MGPYKPGTGNILFTKTINGVHSSKIVLAIDSSGLLKSLKIPSQEDRNTGFFLKICLQRFNCGSGDVHPAS